MNGFIAVGFFLVTVFFSIATSLLWFRIALRYIKISVLNPISQMVYKVTDPLVSPAYSLTHYFKYTIKRYDWPVFITLLLVLLVKYLLLGSFFYPSLLTSGLFILYMTAELITQPCNLLFYALLIRVLMSWFNPTWRHPFADILYWLTEPLLQVGRKIIPDISGFDFSPLVMMLLLKVISLLIHGSLPLMPFY